MWNALQITTTVKLGRTYLNRATSKIYLYKTGIDPVFCVTFPTNERHDLQFTQADRVSRGRHGPQSSPGLVLKVPGIRIAWFSVINMASVDGIGFGSKH